MQTTKKEAQVSAEDLETWKYYFRQFFSEALVNQWYSEAKNSPRTTYILIHLMVRIVSKELKRLERLVEVDSLPVEEGVFSDQNDSL